MSRNSLEITYTALSDLKVYDKNPRTHSPEQVAQIVASVQEFGFTNPILVDEDGVIIAGHGRLLAAQYMRMEEVPTICLRGLSEDQKKALVIADNQIALNAGWDMDLLRSEVQLLGDANFDLSILGFEDDVLAGLLVSPTDGQTDPDAAPPLPARPVTVTGDTWILGKHRLRCGDSTVATDVEALLAGVTPHLMVTDPPYGVEYDPSWRKKSGLGGEGVATGKVQNDDRADWTDAWNLFPGDVAYVWHGALHNVTVAKSLVDAGFKVRSQIVWVKTRAPISRGNYHWQHEPAFYAEKEDGYDGPEWSVDQDDLTYSVRIGKTAKWQGSRKETTVWFIEHLKNDTGHGTQKPVECMRRPIVNNSSAGQAVYEPFSGSGSTIIAGEMEARCVYAMELDAGYVDVAVKRWQDFTGKKAVLEGDGRTFDEIAGDRLLPSVEGDEAA